MKKTFALIFVSLLPIAGQEIKFPASFDKLAEKATEVVNVTLDSSTLQLASRFLGGKGRDEAKVQKLVAGLRGIYVRSFQFAKEGEYSAADIEAIRSQLSGPAWSQVASVRSQKEGENVDIYVVKEGERITGLTVLAAEPKELTVVNIVGPIDMDQLAELGGHFGVPKVKVKAK